MSRIRHTTISAYQFGSGTTVVENADLHQPSALFRFQTKERVSVTIFFVDLIVNIIIPIVQLCQQILIKKLIFFMKTLKQMVKKRTLQEVLYIKVRILMLC